MILDNDPHKRGKYLKITSNFNYFVQRSRMTFPESLVFMAGSDSQPADTDSPSPGLTSHFQESMNVHNGTGISAALTLHQFFGILQWFI